MWNTQILKSSWQLSLEVFLQVDVYIIKLQKTMATEFFPSLISVFSQPRFM